MAEPKKEKKITVKFFLNQVVEPVRGEGKAKYYPLYVQVTYNRKNMQFKSRYSEYYSDLKELKPSLLQFEERVIKAIISHGAGKEKGDYDLKGLKKKYDVYSISIIDALEHYLKPKLRLAVYKTGSELSLTLDFNSTQATVGRLYQASELLFKNFDTYLSGKLKIELEAYHQYQQLYKPALNYNFPVLIDWMDGTYKQELEAMLLTVYKSKPELVKEIKALIDHSVKEKLKEPEE